jgi:hypothetical protein
MKTITGFTRFKTWEKLTHEDEYAYAIIVYNTVEGCCSDGVKESYRVKINTHIPKNKRSYTGWICKGDDAGQLWVWVWRKKSRAEECCDYAQKVRVTYDD